MKRKTIRKHIVIATVNIGHIQPLCSLPYHTPHVTEILVKVHLKKDQSAMSCNEWELNLMKL